MHQHRNARRLPIQRHLFEKVRVSHERRRAGHAHDLAPFWHDEEEADTRIFEDVEKRICTLVAEPVGYRQRMFVKNLYKTCRIAFTSVAVVIGALARYIVSSPTV